MWSLSRRGLLCGFLSASSDLAGEHIGRFRVLRDSRVRAIHQPPIGSRATLSKRFTFFDEGSYENTRQRPNFEIDARSRRTEESAGAGVGANVTRRLELELAGGDRAVFLDRDGVINRPAAAG